ncbi:MULTISPECIES: hypothetical protein [unclassified Saccharibacter]|uniref:hypothetical protein n=1 Tax=unclassified Saccharibacter TaxID=2648722 RepID=UPI00132B2FAB|nr:MULTISPECIES: hypothetical protein [unclassified Saccharibacter]MXV35247.1 hypothetical protein [Saccharibacter sp. EH611]MXV57206.1 hypothetical protein [Saccharibacter sp. EH70]MXV64933.1 hypothetical protein [Saccharibacter sp. EH60]
MTSLTRVASVALLTSSLAGPVYAANVSAPTVPQTPPTSASTTQQTAPAASPSHAEHAAMSKTTSSVSTQNSPLATDKNVHTESTPTAEQASAPQQKTPASTQSALTADKNAHTENTQNTAQTPTAQQQAPTSTQDTTTDKNAHASSSSSSEESAQGSHTAAAAAASSQNTPSPQAPPVVDTQSFTDAGIPSNDEKSWVGIGVRDGHTAASLNHIFEQTVSNPHHKETDNPEFFNNIHPIVDALNDHKFTLGDLSTLIAEHHHQEEEGKAEELGPDLTNIIIDSAAKIHHGASAQETVSEITAQQHAIDEAEKKEQND